MAEGTCNGCGECCSSLLPLSKREIKELHEYVKKHHITPRPFLGPLDCPFCDKSKAKDKCLVYLVRPWICRVFYCEETKVSIRALKVPRKIVNMQYEFGRIVNDKI